MEAVDHNNRDKLFLQSLRKVVLDNLQNDQFGVDHLADSFGISRSQLHRKLKKLTNKSASQFIREIRLDESLTLLQNNTLTVSEVAYRVGFNNPNYFNTTFKNYFGYSPGQAKIMAPADLTDGLFTEPLKETLPIPKLENKKRRSFQSIFWSLMLMVVVVFGVFFISYFTKSDLGLQKNNSEKSVVVLPLKNWSGKEELSYVPDGITDAIITNLSNLQSIDRTVPMASVIQYRNTSKPIEIIAKETGVKTVVHGSFQKFGNEIRIKIQIFDIDSQKQIFSQEFKNKWDRVELFNLQNKITQSVIKGLEVNVLEKELIKLQEFPTQSKEAYDLFLQGKYEWSKGTKLGFENAKNYFQQSIAMDSTFIEPYVNIYLIWRLGAGVWGYYHVEQAEKFGKDYLLKALELAPENEKVIDAFLRYSLFDERNFTLLEEKYESTLIAPLYLNYVGRYEEALDYMENADFLLKQDESLYSFWYAETLFYNGRFEKALEIYMDDFKKFKSDYDWLRESTKYLVYLGEYELAKKRLERLKRIFPERPPIIIWLELVINESIGTNANNTDLLKQIINSKKGNPNWFVALYYAYINETETALYWLKRTYENGETALTWLHSEPLLAPLRQDPFYIKIHRELGFPYPPLD